MNTRDNKQCQSCIFYGLCTKANLDHCEGEYYFEDKKGEKDND